MTRTSNLIHSIIDTLESNRCKSAQVMTSTIGDAYCIKIINLSTQRFKDKVVRLVETNYCESVNKVSEGRTYVIYQVATRNQIREEIALDPMTHELNKYIQDNYVEEV